MALAMSGWRIYARLRCNAARHDATDASNTYSNVWIILWYGLMRWRRRSFPWRRRGRAMLEKGQDCAILLLLFLRYGLCSACFRNLDLHLVVGRGRRGQRRIGIGHGWWCLGVDVGGGSCGCSCGTRRGTTNRARLGRHEVMLLSLAQRSTDWVPVMQDNEHIHQGIFV